MLKVSGDEIGYERRGEKARIAAFGPDVIRFTAAPGGEILDEDYDMIVPDEAKGGGSARAYMDGDKAVLENGSMSAVMEENGKVTFFRNGRVILEEMTEYAFNSFYRTYRAVGDEAFCAKILFKPDKSEHLYGLGQEANDCFDLFGTSSNLEHRNTKSTVPFVYSSKGYGFLWNSPSVGECELTKNRYRWAANRTNQVDYLLIGGDSPKEVMGRYADLTGHTPDFPEFASGFWQSKLRYESQDDLLEVAREYKKRNIPISVIVIDYFHWTEQGDWKFDPELWPDVPGMVKELKDMGIELMVSIWPTTNPRAENYAYMDERNMILRTESGLYGMLDFYGQQAYVDVLKKETREFVWKKVKENYYDQGVRYFWLDEAEPGLVPNHYDHIRCCRGNFEAYALRYPYDYARLFYEGLKASGEKDMITLERAAYKGIQRFGTLVWSGDLESTFDNLRKSVKTGLSMAMSGIPWWTTDIGGFWGGDTESDYFRELIVRWFQFGVFCPVTRLHGTRIRPSAYFTRHEGLKEESGGDNEIWSFGERNYEILKELVEVRESLRPYVMKYMKEAKETGVSIMRPMFVEYPEDEECYCLEDQYMFGEDILFAPITEQGAAEREVYLPKGSWVRVGSKNTGKTIEMLQGGRVRAKAKLDEYIAYVKAGSEVLKRVQFGGKC